MRPSPSSHARPLLTAALLAAGCTGPDPGREPDVYVAGWSSNGTVSVARLWTNGQPRDLSDGAHAALATGVAVSGQDVYVSGGVDRGNFDAATYWKNGTEVALTDGSVQAFGEAIAVSGEDVYVVGYSSPAGIPIATVWKDGVPAALTDGTRDADALAVAVSGLDVYVAGYELGITEISPGAYVIADVAKVWKNGVATALSDPRNAAVATSVFISGGDVYVAGLVGTGSRFVATVWKNGVPLSLTDGVYDAAATGIAFDGGEVLVSGTEYDGSADVAKIWRDGVPMDLTSSDPQGNVQPAVAEAVCAVGGDVYAAGYHGTAAVYWKNGTEIRLSSGSYYAHAQAIAVAVR